jgi:hypothetical protein
MKNKDDGLTKWERYRLKDLEGYRAQKRAYIKKPEVREKRRLEQAAWREKNRTHYNAWARANYGKNRENVRLRAYWYRIKCVYGITFEEWAAMMERQNHSCAICGGKQGARRLHIDHCHATWKVRGLLCSRCNTSLGWFEKHAENAKTYLTGMVW